MKFLKLNWIKIIIRWLFNLLWIEFIFMFIYLYERSRGNNLVIDLLVLPAIIFGTFTSLITALLNMFSYYLSNRYCKAPSGIRTLFDNEPQSQIVHQKSFFTYANMSLSGNIRSIPSELEYSLDYGLFNRSGAKSTRSTLKGTFHIVNMLNKPQTVEHSFSLEIDLKFRIRSDYRTEVFTFIDKLKSDESAQ